MLMIVLTTFYGSAYINNDLLVSHRDLAMFLMGSSNLFGDHFGTLFPKKKVPLLHDHPRAITIKILELITPTDLYLIYEMRFPHIHILLFVLQIYSSLNKNIQ